MSTLRKQIKSELLTLLHQCAEMLSAFNNDRNLNALSDYQKWYSRAIAVVRQLLPERIAEFTLLYQGKPIEAKTMNLAAANYGISDYLLGIRITAGATPKDLFDHEAVVLMKAKQQLDILWSAESRLDDILSNISGVLQAELFDTELGAARELLKTGHLRAAGTVAGVVLERHLSVFAKNQGVPMRKKNPTISDWNDVLKAGEKVDVPTWRFIQWLGDIRNLCTHQKGRKPKADEVRELIDGVEKLTKTLL